MSDDHAEQHDAHGIDRWSPPRIKMKDAAAIRDWPSYFQSAAGTPPRDTLTRALSLFDDDPPADADGRPFAIDLGCGEGRDTQELVARGWTVLAIDGHADAREHIGARFADRPSDLAHVDIDIATFGECPLPETVFVNASYALPFCPPERFDALWTQIRDAVRPGGRFAGQLFGDRHGWAALPDRTHHTREQVDALLSGWTVEHLHEEFGEGEPDWHVFHIVARRPQH